MMIGVGGVRSPLDRGASDTSGTGSVPSSSSSHSCSNVQIPGYLQHQAAVRAAGIDEILIVAVNDGAVMAAWFQHQQLKGETLFQMMGDPTGALTRACGLELTDPGPRQNGLLGRSQRAALIVVHNVIRYVAVSAAPDDPAGDRDPSATCHEAILRVCREELRLPQLRNQRESTPAPHGS
jgi:peroxiredoxin